MSRTSPSPELEARLRTTLATVIPTLLDDVSAPEPAPQRRQRRPNTALAVAAAVVLVVVGSLLFVRTRSGDVVSTVSPATTTPATTADLSPSLPTPTVADEILVAPVDVPWLESDMPTPPWDPITIAPGTFWRYELDMSLVSADLRALLGDASTMDDGFVSSFFTCDSWQPAVGSVMDGTLTAADMMCTQLSGGYREVVEHGDVLSIGSGTGRSIWTPGPPTSAEDLLNGLAPGSLRGHEDSAGTPVVTVRDVDGTPAASARSGDQAYLVLEPDDGQFAWLHGRGLDDDQLFELAGALRRITAPDALRVPVGLGPDAANDGSSDGTQLRLVWLDGRPCVGIRLWERCTPADVGPTLVRGHRFGDEQLPSVAAIVPAGGTEQLVVELFGVEAPTRPERTFAGLGIESWTFWPGTERLISATLFGSAGETLSFTQWSVQSLLDDAPSDLMAEGRTSGTAWVVVRQDPSSASRPTPGEQATVYFGGAYCWLLSEAGGGGIGGLCPPAAGPPSGFGSSSLGNATLSLIELGPDVDALTCGDEPLEIVIDPQLDGRRFAVTSCDDPQIVR